MLAAPVALYFLYLAIDELQLLYFYQTPKQTIGWRTEIPPARRKDIEVMRSEAARAAKMTQDLLDYSGKPRPKYQVMDVERPLDEALNLIDGRLAAAEIKIVKSMQKPLPYVSIDPDQIKQAFINVMNNAVDVMPGGGQLEVYVTQNDNDIEICFIDTGTGMSQEMMGRIFQPFYSSKGSGGTGLGLSLAKSIMAQHRGTIDVASEWGIGTTFTLKLPVISEKSVIINTKTGSGP